MPPVGPKPPREAGHMLVLGAVLLSVAALLHPILPEEPSRMARTILDAGHIWLLVHMLFLGGALFAVGGIRNALPWVPPPKGAWRTPTLACLYVGPSLLAIVMLMEITVLLADAPAAASGDATGRRDHARVFDVVAALFHAGTALAALGMGLWCLAARQVGGLTRWWAIGGAVAAPFAFIASVLATNLDAPWTLVVGVPGLGFLIVWTAWLGAILWWSGFAGLTRRGASRRTGA